MLNSTVLLVLLKYITTCLLYEDLIKIKAIVLFLLYIEVIGLNIWLTSIGVLGILL